MSTIDYVKRYNLKECQLVLRDVKKTFRIVRNRINLPRFKYKCYICLETFATSFDLMTHKTKFKKKECKALNRIKPKYKRKKKNKVDTGIFSCKFCLKVFLTEAGLCRHNHNGENFHNIIQTPEISTPVNLVYEGVIARKQPSSSILMEENVIHSKILVPYQMRPPNNLINNFHFHCSKCDKNFLAFDDFKEHVIKGKCYSRGKCTVCSAIFDKNRELYEHVVEIHPEQHICELCYKLFDVYGDLAIHMRLTHFKRFGHACLACCNGLATYYECLTEQEKELLEKYSIRESRVELPDITLDKSIKIVNGTAKVPSDGGRRKHVCSICKKKFATPKEFIKHKQTHEDEDEDDDDEVVILPEKPRKKAVPAKKLPKSTSKATPAKNTIKNYFRKTEKNERPQLAHMCETCDDKFTSVNDIKKHSSSKCRFKCGVCHKTYNTVYAFTVHVLQHKINLFNTSSASDKLHKCSLCPESFDDFIDLKTHSIITHKVKSTSDLQDESESNPEETNGDDSEISCELCFDIFESVEELKEHMEFHKQLGEKSGKKVLGESSVDTEENPEITKENSPEVIEDEEEQDVKCVTEEISVELNPVPVIESSYSLAGEEPVAPRTLSTPSTKPVEEEKEEDKEEECNTKYLVLPPNTTIPRKHYKCNKCERVYMSVDEFNSHEPAACKIEKSCPVCMATLTTNSEWYAHITETHRKWATCKYCFETFNEVKKLDQHKVAKHFNTFKNVCKICFECFATYQEFNEHLKKKHLNL